MAVCMTGCVSVPSVPVYLSVSMSMTLGYVLSFVTGEACKGLSDSHLPQPGKICWILRHQVGLQEPGSRGPELLEDVPHSSIT